MNLEIYNSILHGSLRPQSGQTPVGYSEISHLLDKCPTTLSEIENRLTQVLGNNLPVNFNTDTPANITQYLNNQDYTAIVIDYFPPEIMLSFPDTQIPIHRFYHFLITAESKRIKLRLLQSVETLKDDICAKQEIKDTLSQLARHAKTIQEQAQPNEIFACLLTQIVKLYFEITLIFDVLLSGQDYISFTDFYSVRLNRQVDEVALSAYSKALHVHQAQRLYNDFDNAAVINLLSQLYSDLAKLPTDNILIAVICALENAIFLQSANIAFPIFAEIVNPDFPKSVLKTRKQILNYQLNTLSNSREALIEIENMTENLPDFPLASPEIAVLLTSSITRQLQYWLAEQKEIYKTIIPVAMTDKNFIQTINAGIVTTGKDSVIQANNSNVIGGQNNTVSLSDDMRKAIEEIIPQITAIANVLSDEQEEITAELARINTQLNRSHPKANIMASAFQTIHSVLCSVTGNVVTPFVMDKIQTIIKIFG
ncbi:MAG: hypothetical protein LBU51_07360 [Bacteroidales bacterium]|jgi:hypothetical protein|nr:hypothetical protein [Bacteroidales bacterium]